MTELTDELKTTIDNMSYEDLLRRWRFAPVGDPMISGDVGTYFSKVISARRASVGGAQHTATSKLIGW